MSTFQQAATLLEQAGFRVINQDLTRPWGGFFVIDEDQSADFIQRFFPEQDQEQLLSGGRLSPKILVVAPEKRLSWQYHHRRAEVWKVLDQPVGVVRSASDEEGALVRHQQGESVVLAQGERHRLVGLEEWGIVAEIWRHVDPAHPSDENDIVRLQDDFGRKTPTEA